jgi:hypothetical protein
MLLSKSQVEISPSAPIEMRTVPSRQVTKRRTPSAMCSANRSVSKRRDAVDWMITLGATRPISGTIAGRQLP